MVDSSDWLQVFLDSKLAFALGVMSEYTVHLNSPQITVAANIRGLPHMGVPETSALKWGNKMQFI